MRKSFIGGLFLALAMVGPVVAQTMDAFQIKTTDLGKGICILVGQGGNIGVSVGPDGVLMVDNQFALLRTNILAAIKTISDRPIRFVLNTH